MKTKKWAYSMPAKIFVYILLQVTFYLTLGCIVSTYLTVSEGFHLMSEQYKKEEYFRNYAMTDGRIALYNLLEGNMRDLKDYDNTNLSLEIFTENGKKLWGNYPASLDETYSLDETIPLGESREPADIVYEFKYDDSNVGNPHLLGSDTYTVKCYIDQDFRVLDKYYFINYFVGIGYTFRYAFYPLALVFGILTVVSFLCLMHMAGHRRGRPEITAGRLTGVYFDLLTAGFLASISVSILATGNNYIYSGYSGYGYAYAYGSYAIGDILGAVLFFLLLPAYCMSIAIRIKLGILWKNTLIYRILRLGYRMVKEAVRVIARLFERLPFMGKVILPAVLIMVLELLVYLALCNEYKIVVFAWLLEKVILVPLILYFAITMRSLQKGGEALAAGNMGYRPDAERLQGVFRQHANNLSNIGEGMNRAVEERMKSERLKTELIANVSHDIESPLTSIINYAEQIIREPGENERIAEYAQVLYRQSERLKRLTQDLQEASEASAGNVEVRLIPCKIGELLAQAAGEFDRRLQENQLELITKQPEGTVWIPADNRLLLRVFDNLLNNIYKYAQRNSRVYLSIEADDDETRVIFKNISACPLDATAEELMERFIRGDKSRNTEGNGLGLSIARSLTELQNGGFELKVDGDLFKVTLAFPVIHTPQEEEGGESGTELQDTESGSRQQETE